MEKTIVKRKLGGAREGAGRPKGGTNKISAKQLIETAEQVIGKPFIESLLEGYRDTIVEGDRRTRVMYEKMIIDKIISDKQDVEVTNTEASIEQRAEAFAAALAQLSNRSKLD